MFFNLVNTFSSFGLAYELTGLSRGGQQVNNCKEVFAKAVTLLVELASLQVNCELYCTIIVTVLCASKLCKMIVNCQSD